MAMFLAGKILLQACNKTNAGANYPGIKELIGQADLVILGLLRGFLDINCRQQNQAGNKENDD